ncbi:MAG: nicotinate (nicotinamide) nucleotide adenylyltransferase [Verrucomicrobiota bacterium]
MNTHKERIAFFGGSFDPVHCGHIAIAQAAVNQSALDRVIFLPAARSPLKHHGPRAGGELRLEMLRSATEGLPWAEVNGWELFRPAPSYSWQTVEYFTSRNRTPSEWFWLMGTDQWEALEKWSRWEHLASMVTFLVFGRDGGKPLQRSGVRAQFLKGQFHGSSTAIRSEIEAGRGIEGLVPPGVEKIIARNKLYHPLRE